MISKPTEYIHNAVIIHWSAPALLSVDNYDIEIQTRKKTNITDEFIKEIAESVLKHQSEGVGYTSENIKVTLSSDRFFVRILFDKFSKWILNFLFFSPYVLQANARAKLDDLIIHLLEAESSATLTEEQKTTIRSIKLDLQAKKAGVIDEIDSLNQRITALISTFKSLHEFQLAYLGKNARQHFENFGDIKASIKIEDGYRKELLAMHKDVAALLGYDYTGIDPCGALHISHDEVETYFKKHFNDFVHKRIKDDIAFVNKNSHLFSPEDQKIIAECNKNSYILDTITFDNVLEFKGIIRDLNELTDALVD